MVRDLKSLLQLLPTATIVVVGDLMLDAYVIGRFGKLSTTHESPILEASRASYRLGGAANVAANLHALGCNVVLVGIVGNDWPGKVLLSLLDERRILSDSIVVDAIATTTLKLRVQEHGKGHLMRVDIESRPRSTGSRIALRKKYEARIGNSDLLLVSDYDKGTVDLIGTDFLVSKAAANNVNLIVASKRRELEGFRGASAVILNREELQRTTSSDAGLEKMAQEIIEKTQCQTLVVTLDGDGAFLRDNSNDRSLIIAAHDVPTVDPTGAGDTFASVFAAILSIDGSIVQGVEVANLAAALSVQRNGVYAVNTFDLLAREDLLEQRL